MILIITHKTDFTADFVINQLNQRKIRYKRFNCEDLFQFPISLNFNGSFNYSILGEHDFKSVWFRRTKLPEIENLSPEERLYVLSETESFLKYLFSSISSKWLSQPDAVYRAENKLLQLKTAQELGFTVPETLITNSKDELIKFYKSNNENIIIKPISQTRIYYDNKLAHIFTNTVPKKFIDEIEKYDLTPCIFQENISKDYEVRATVVGKKVFSSAVYSQADEETKTDWRRKKLRFIETELPDEIQNLCIQIVQKMNLNFGAIDLIKNKEGKYTFLEINPNGQWAWIESQTGQKISEAIIQFLIN